MASAELIGGNKWRVTDDSGNTVTHFAKAGDDAEDVLASFTEATATPSDAAILANVKANAKGQVVRALNAATEAILAKYPMGERMAFDAMASAAAAYRANPQTITAEQTAMLQRRTAATGETMADLTAQIASNAAAFALVGLSMSGLRKSARDAIDAASDAEGVAAALASFRTALASL